MTRKILKRKFTLARGFKKYVFADNDSITMTDVVEVCKLLNKRYFIMELFTKDLLNQETMSFAICSHNDGNLSFHVLDSLDFLSLYNVNSLRHFCIYAVSNPFETKMDSKWLMKNSAFFMVDENYMDTFELYIHTNSYPNDIIDPWLIKFVR